LENSVALAQRQQMRQMQFQNNWNDLVELEKRFNPPPPTPEPEPDVIYLSEDECGTARLGHSDFNPRLMARPQSWW
jgi:hypothetical protein